MMQSTSQQPCHHRIKRILQSYQQSAEHSLKGPNIDNVRTARGELAAASSSKTFPDTARAVGLFKTPSGGDEIVSSVATAIKVEKSWDPREAVALARLAPRMSPCLVPNLPMLMAAEGSELYEVTETILKDHVISCFNVGGERRLCMPEVLNKVLCSFGREQIQSASDSLHVNFAECNAAQLDALKRRGVLPSGVARCGLVTLTDAERLCAALLDSQPAACPSRLDSTAIPVAHECFGGCKGVFLPHEYVLPTSKCIECLECSGRLSPPEFVSHSHNCLEDRVCHWGFDVSNWRFYIMVSQDVVDMSELPKLLKKLDDLKSLFNGKEIPQIVKTEDDINRGGKKVKLDTCESGVPIVAVKSSSSSTESVKWKPVNVYTTWAACLNAVQQLKHAQHSLSSSSVPPYLFTGTPVLDHPDRVIPFEDADRYDRNYAPNVSLSAEPFDELRKLRQDEIDEDSNDDMTATGANCNTVVPSSSARRRSTHSSCDARHLVDDEDEEYDTESVSSDKLDADEETLADEADTAKCQLVDLDGQLAFVKTALRDCGNMDHSEVQALMRRFAFLQDPHLQTARFLDGNERLLKQTLRQLVTFLEAQRRESEATKRRHDEELQRLRQEGAARMREAALERHSLLQQIESLSGSNSSSDQAVMAARYKDEAEYWKSRLEKSEAMNGRLQQELAELRQALIASQQQQQQTIWMSAADSATVDGSQVIAVLVADEQKCC